MNNRFFLLGLCLLISINTVAQQQIMYRGSWHMGQTGVNTTLNQSCTKPTLLLEEDFTDGAFDNFNSGANGSNWSIFDVGSAFRAPNNRGFPIALSRRPSLGGSGWSGALWGNKINPAGPTEDGNLVEYLIDKKDDVFVTKFRAFSDFTHTNERAGVEVANMEYRNVLCPPPDFCHDLSFEAKQCFYSRPQDDLQLETNVENLGNRTNIGARRAHYNNLTTKANLDFEYDNLVIWRNNPTTKRCNVEQWGHANYGDFWLDTHMVSKLDPNNPFAIVSVVQISLFRNDTNFLILRDNILRRDAQIGIMNVHSGFTKKSDFNLDYRIDAADVAIWKKYLGRADSATIRRGDANNDGKISGEDALAIAAFWSDSSAHPAAASASGTYNPISGEITLSANNIHYLSVVLPTSVALSNSQAFASLPADTFFVEQNMVSFFSTSGFQLSGFNLGAIAPPNMDPADIQLTLNYMGSCVADGFTITLDSGFVLTETNKLLATRKVSILGQSFNVPESNDVISVRIYDINGKQIFKKTDKIDDISMNAHRFSNNQLLLLQVSHPTNGVIYGRKKVMIK
jgi:hypothetical protein